jgi:2-keto-4-pentenoate hydratase/2-oxohepta-3-ene-1,7-dioic acid hydratase in catechol pathway
VKQAYDEEGGRDYKGLLDMVYNITGGAGMKHACFLTRGHYHEGILVEPGMLLDESGTSHHEDGVTFLPPVMPHSVIGVALNFADHAAELSVATPEEPGGRGTPGNRGTPTVSG